MNTENLTKIQRRIEKLSDTTHFEIFKIFKNYGVQFNENKNGIFINLINISEECYIEVDKYITWLEEQIEFLKKDEEIKNEYKENFFN